MNMNMLLSLKSNTIKIFNYIVFAACLVLLLAACSKDDEWGNKEPDIVYPPLQIFQTEGDYTEYVPLGVSDDLKTVLSIPATKGSSFPSPVIPLHEGWYLDQTVLFFRICYSTVKWEDYNSGTVDHHDVENSINRSAYATHWGYLPTEISDAYWACQTHGGDISIINDYIDAGLPGFEMKTE